ncbi:hypothetical protein AC1031_020501 [Aphanomyces cochlioides]|nr:hypothetical protein AC1031_020501 [Aphanomyces cochlioides]
MRLVISIPRVFQSFLNSPPQYNMKTTAILAIALASTVQGATCGLEVAQMFTDATTSPEALTCVKDSGISLAPNTKYTDADLAKVLAVPSCTTYWDGVIKKVNAVNPPSDFPNPKGDGTTLNSATFKWTFKDLFSLGAANSTTSGATDSPATTTAAPTTTPKSSSVVAVASTLIVAGVALLA